MDKVMSIEESFNEEIYKSERLRSIILVGLLVLETIFLLIIYSFYKEQYLQIFNTYISFYAILIFTILIIIYELVIQFLIGRNKFHISNPRIFSYFNSFAEITLLSFLLIFIVEYSEQPVILQTPATLTYFIFIILSTLRLNFKLSIFIGSLAALEYVFISIYYSTLFSSMSIAQFHLELTGMQYLGQGSIMIIAGIAAGFVSNFIKKKIIISSNNLREKNKVIDLFGQQISPQIVENILKNKSELLGVRKKVCIMFIDIRQFTPFVEKHQPEEVVAYLNTLFGFMIDIVQAHHGVINQFLGDGFMATFGAPVAIGNSSQNATDASQEIINMLKIEFKKGNIPETRIGIGLHYDEAVTGNIGSSVRKQYSITGRVVIMASRIEQLNKKYKTQLLISKEVFNQLNEISQSSFDWLEFCEIKGSKKLVSLYKFNAK